MMQFLIEPFYLQMLRLYPNKILNDNYKYRSKLRGKFLSTRGLRKNIDSHHLIPKQLKHHGTVINENFDINRSYNLIYLPNYRFTRSEELPLHIHHGGHRKYNAYVLCQLNEIDQLSDKEEKRYMFWLLLKHLEQGILDKSLPWN